ncbi:MAG TPA: acyltransferase [Longimicrobium sp.]|jgi:acetyltransferase-like isoleucine patch superfamily enzyme|nr:acyltransferase [Longimicrobium sp.]
MALLDVPSTASAPAAPTAGAEGAWDPNVIVGYLPERRVASTELVLGPGSRLRAGTIVYAGSRIGAGLQTGHNVVIREENVIGDGVSVWSNTVIDYGCVIGDRVKIHSNVYIPQFSVIEDDVFIAPGCTFANDMHPGCVCSEYENMKGPTIRRGARIGVNVTMTPGVEIGAYALVGSGSVVTRDVPPGAVVAGSPARVTKMTNELRCFDGAAAYPDDPRA